MIARHHSPQCQLLQDPLIVPEVEPSEEQIAQADRRRLCANGQSQIALSLEDPVTWHFENFESSFCFVLVVVSW